MYMKLKDPKQLRQMYAERCKWYTIDDIAKGVDVSNKTVSKALLGQPMYPATVKKFAERLGVEVTDIASFIN